MFAKNAAAVAQGGVKRKTTTDAHAGMPAAQDADALLEDILAGVGPSAGASSAGAQPAPAVARARVLPPVVARPARPVNQFRRPAPAQPPPSVAATPATLVNDVETPTAPGPNRGAGRRGVTFAASEKDDAEEYTLNPPL